MAPVPVVEALLAVQHRQAVAAGTAADSSGVVLAAGYYIRPVVPVPADIPAELEAVRHIPAEIQLSYRQNPYRSL